MPPNEPAAGILLRLLGCGVCVLLGAFPILAGLGLLRLEKPIEPLAMPVAILFGAVFVALGVAFVFSPMRALARARGATTWRQAIALSGRLLVARCGGRSAAAAAGVALLALACWFSVAGIHLVAFADEEALAAAVHIEFLTIHAFPFLVIGIGFVVFGTGALRAVAAVIALMIAIAYGVLAWAFGGGIAGIGWLAFLLVPNLVTVLRPDPSTGAVVLALSRWCIKFALFAFVSGTVGDGGKTSAATVVVGAVYFTLLAALELVRAFDIPLDLANAWSGATRTTAATGERR